MTHTQAQAILDMRLQRLVALEREKIQDEHKELEKRIAYLESVLADERLVIGIIKTNCWRSERSMLMSDGLGSSTPPVKSRWKTC